MKRILVDFHHSSLLRSLVMLFGIRLDMEVYRPIGMDWFHEGYWAINNQEDTARQYLDLDQAFQPSDGTPPLNEIHQSKTAQVGTYWVLDPGGNTAHRAATIDFFKKTQFDYVLASIPAHVGLYEKLVAKYQPNAKLIIQMGNNWNIKQYKGKNVLASMAPQYIDDVNVLFYHQEFDTKIFHPAPTEVTKKIYSFTNIIQGTGVGWQDYMQLRDLLPAYEFKAFGGQCPDGNMTGPVELAHKMREAQFIFHVKPGGDGFGHIIHNAYAVGRPVITRPSHYKGQLAEQLLVPGTYIDLDRYGPAEVKNIIERLSQDPDGLRQMGERAANRFREVVNYQTEARMVEKWLKTLL